MSNIYTHYLQLIWTKSFISQPHQFQRRMASYENAKVLGHKLLPNTWRPFDHQYFEGSVTCLGKLNLTSLDKVREVGWSKRIHVSCLIRIVCPYAASRFIHVQLLLASIKNKQRSGIRNCKAWVKNSTLPPIFWAKIPMVATMPGTCNKSFLPRNQHRLGPV